MSSNFFDTNTFFIDEEVNLFKFENCYNLFNDSGMNIGAVKQKLTGWHKIISLFIGKQMMPFYIEIRNSDGQLESSISRGWTFWLSQITIKDSLGAEIGYIKQKFKFIKPSFKIFNKFDTQIAEISGDWKAWDFIIKDHTNMQIGTVSKKWAGVMKEIFTSADKYIVSIDPNYSSKENKIIILSSAITIDMVLKESKN